MMFATRTLLLGKRAEIRDSSVSAGVLWRSSIISNWDNNRDCGIRIVSYGI